MVKRSRKYEGLLWSKTLKVIKACLYKTRSLTGSQCSLMSAGVICFNLLARSTTRVCISTLITPQAHHSLSQMTQQCT